MSPAALPPEIHMMIAQQLQHQDLSHAALVNKAWYSTCNPQLYQTVRLTTPLQHQRFLDMLLSNKIRRHACHIKVLLTRYIDVISPMMRLSDDNNTINNNNSYNHIKSGGLLLIGLEILTHRALRILNSREDNILLSFIKNNPQLLHLAIRRKSENTKKYFSTIASSLPHLRTLNMFDILGARAPFVIKREIVHFLNTCSPDLERLVLALNILTYDEFPPDEDHIDNNSSSNNNNRRVQDPSTPRALKFLSVRSNTEAPLVQFLTSCPALTAVINPEFQASLSASLLYHSSPFHLALQETTGIRFKELHVPQTSTPEYDSANTSDHDIANLISSISSSPDRVQQQWRTIAINGAITGGTDEIVRAIVNNCREGLVHLHIAGGQQRSQDIHSILCSATDLRVFSVIQLPRMDAADVISSPWRCRWLTKLSVQIFNIPRPDILIDRKGKLRTASDRATEGSIEESRAIQRAIYRQLGALTCLEFLDLGIDIEYGMSGELVDDYDGTIYDPKFQLDCLEMSLASGLYLLGDLQNLRSLRVVGMEHRLGIPELQWMMQHFFRLEQLSGVDPEVCYLPLYLLPTRMYQAEPGVQQWLSSQAMTWELLEYCNNTIDSPDITDDICLLITNQPGHQGLGRTTLLKKT
ncbi:MAG: hypothetical protein J3R72DRAFT_242943 [Linnemannia gamsii]|nr:MAG: hypothetical protein J3R72DRAFT_242943 [Linnemannia gamsii]